ncbi:MAG: NHL repeat-containing protein [Planctomycetes bacterium]|nr:NHL repeat-containing protein [Planctomycetota bacterium]
MNPSAGLFGALDAEPFLELGAQSPGGLRLPDAKPSRSALYAPRCVAFVPSHDGAPPSLVVADTGNHRVMIFERLGESFADAAIVLGQADFDTEGPHAAGRGIDSGLHLPTGLLVHEGRLLVCDSWHHRVLVWNTFPTGSDQRPDWVLGQASLDHGERNRGGAISASGFDCPYGLAVIDGDLHVADTQNRRVLAWDGVPVEDRPADRVVGQDDFESGEENRGRGVGADTFRWPHAIASSRPGELWIADAGNHRLLGFGDGTDRSGPADRLVGQERFDIAFELPHRPQGPGRLRFPYGLVSDDRHVFVADTANNRVLAYRAPLSGHDEAVAVLGQPDFDKAGENRWTEVAPDTLCWPYGLALHRDPTLGTLLAIADSGNNRVVVWRVNQETRT